MVKIAPLKPEFVKVRRQPNDSQKIATYAFDDVKDYRWDIISGGSRHYTPYSTLFAYVICTQMIDGEIGHSGIHGPCPHVIKVAITRKDNLDSYDFLANLAGPKPANTNRKQLKKAEKADIIYLMWTAKTASAQYNQSNLINTPDIVYADTTNAAFIKRCQTLKVNWGLISPVNGVWLPNENNMHSSRRLGELCTLEKTTLIDSMRNKLSKYQNIRVYAPQGYDKTKLHEEIVKATGLKVLLLETIKDIGVK